MNDHDLLIQLLEKVENLIKAFDKVSNGTGFPRCVGRAMELEALNIKTTALDKKIDAFDNKVEALDEKLDQNATSDNDRWFYVLAAIAGGALVFIINMLKDSL